MVKSGKSILALSATAAALICFLVYLRALSCDFVYFDDPSYVLENVTIRQLDGNLVADAFSKPFYGLWLPLTCISYGIDYHFWGLNPFGYHLTNILLHAVNAALVVFVADGLFRVVFAERDVLSRGYPWILLLASLLFALHPLRVESVAWISGRKDVLSGMFILGTILFYLRYVEMSRWGGKKQRLRGYLLFFILYLLSLMAKPVAVVIPAMLLVLDWYPLGRLRKGEITPILAEKLPLVIAAFGVSFVTIIITAQGNQFIPVDQLPFFDRFVISGNAVFEYCRLLLYPVGIVPVYLTPLDIPVGFAVKTVVVILFTCFCVLAARRLPMLPATWFSFVIPLLPVLAFLQNSDGAAMAAHYTYIPSLASSIAVAAVAGTLGMTIAAKRKYYGTALATFCLVLLVFYGVLSIRLIGVWQNTVTLWTRQIAIQPFGRVFQERGLHYLASGDYEAAAADLLQAIDIANRSTSPAGFNLYAFCGEALRHAGRYEEAVTSYSKAIDMFPHPSYYHGRGLALKAIGRIEPAQKDLALAGASPPRIEWF